MKKNIHPDYHPVVFRDTSANYTFLTRSTASPAKTIVWSDGNTYPVVDIEVSDASHPFYTGTARVVDTAGRIEKFNRRYGRPAAATPATQSTSPQPAARPQIEGLR